MKRVLRFLPLLTLASMLCFTVALAAQATPQAEPQKPAATPDKNDISGMYTFLKDGEFVQINQEEGGVISGFVSRFGDDETDKKTFLDQFFSRASLKGDQLEFTTKTVHGTWFEFKGTVQRGPGKTPADEAFRIIKGKLTRHKIDAKGKESAESREIEMKSFPADMDDDDDQ